MRKLWVLVFAALLMVQLAPVSSTAQTETGQIIGTVTDASGAVVPTAKVTIKNVGTGAERNAETDDRGTFIVTNLQPAVYQVTVEKQGFAKTERRVQVTVGSKVSVDLSLTVGQATTVVEVTAEAGIAINTETQTLSTLIDRKKLELLPLITRNPYDLVLTSGNISAGDPSGRGAAGVAINGLRAASTNILLDGTANNNEFTATLGQQVPLESVQEFSVLTNNFTAEYGRASGGIVNVATRAGTNDLHGTAYWFGRYSALASNSYDNNANGLKKPVFVRNQFGYSVGGPVVKDKLHFFQSTEWIRVRSTFNRVVVIPHADLIAASAATTRGFFSSLGTLRSNFNALRTYTKDQLIAGGQNPCPATGVCAGLPGSTNFFVQGQYAVPFDSGGGVPQNTYMLVGRADWNISSKTQLYGRYALYNEDRQTGVNTNSPYKGYDTGFHSKQNNFLISVTHELSPKVTSQSKLVFNRLNEFQPLGDNPVGPTLYMLAGTPQRIQGNLLAFPGYSPFTPGSAVPFGGPQNYAQAYQDMSWTKGRHTVRFGGSYVYLRDNRVFGAYQEAVETLSLTGFATGVENFLNGRIVQFQAAVDPQGKFPCTSLGPPPVPSPQCVLTLPVGPPNFSRSNRYHEFAFYGQDSWRVTPRITLNLGLRWEYFGVQHNKNAGLDSNYYDAVGGSVFQGIRGGDVAIASNSPVGGLWRKQWNNFGPRVGFAWDVFGNGKTSLRGGYGIAYERNFGNVTFNVIQNPPAYAVISIISNVDVPTWISITTDNAGPLGGSTGTKALPPVSLRNVDSNIRTAYAHLWSASVEREVLKNLFVAVDYSGSKGVKLYTLENPNRIGAGNVYLGDCRTGPGCGLRRLRTTQYTNINRRGGNGLSLYNALNTRVDIRNIGNSGLTLRANYTWSHAIDNLSSTFSESDNNINLGLLDPFNPKLDRGNADFDGRHRFVLSATWEVPFARNLSSAVAKKVLDGWSLAPIFSARTGFPFTLFDSGNAFAVAPRAMVRGSRPPRTGADNIPATGTPNTFNYIVLSGITFDRTYVNPIVGLSDFGPYPATMLPRNYFRAPGAWNLDIGIYKTTKITERFSLQFRGEMFNMFNHSNLWVVLGDNDIDSIGVVRAKKGVRSDGTKENRHVQMALKLIF